MRSLFSKFNEAVIKLLYLPIIQTMNEIIDIFHVIRKTVNKLYIATLKKIPNPRTLNSFRLKYQQI